MQLVGRFALLCVDAESAIAYTLDSILTPGMRKPAGNDAAFVDWAVAGDDVASPIAAVSPGDYTSDESAFPYGL